MYIFSTRNKQIYLYNNILPIKSYFNINCSHFNSVIIPRGNHTVIYISFLLLFWNKLWNIYFLSIKLSIALVVALNYGASHKTITIIRWDECKWNELDDHSQTDYYRTLSIQQTPSCKKLWQISKIFMVKSCTRRVENFFIVLKSQLKIKWHLHTVHTLLFAY